MTCTYHHLPPNSPEWLAHRQRPTPDGGPAIGGSDLWRLLGMSSFVGRPTAQHAGLGHVLEPLILARLAQILDLPQLESGWCVEQDYRRGSLDTLAPDACVGEAKAVFAGQAHQWACTGATDPLDGLAAHVRYQALWYAGITSLPVHIAALMLPGYGLDLAPERAAWQHELRIYTIDPVEHADEIAELFALVDDLRASGRTLPECAPAPAPRPNKGQILSGSLDDGRILARYAECRVRRNAAIEALEHAAVAVRALIPSDARGIHAGGYSATIDQRGTLRVT